MTQNKIFSLLRKTPFACVSYRTVKSDNRNLSNCYLITRRKLFTSVLKLEIYREEKENEATF